MARIENAPPKRRWYQFRLRTLLVLVTLVCVGLGLVNWLTHERQMARERNEWLASIKGDDTTISYHSESSSQPGWLRILIGDDSTADLSKLWTFNSQVTDADLAHLASSHKLIELQLINVQVSDAGLVHLADLTKLEYLNLNGTKITDAGLEHLASLTQLQHLELNATQVTDAGLVHLHGLTNVQKLHLLNTQTTPAGRQILRQSLPKTKIYPNP